MNTSLAVGVLILVGFLGSRVARAVKLPAISGYLIIGIMLGPSAFNILSSEITQNLSHFLTPLALGIIAYLIGGSLPLSTLRGLKGKIAVITAAQAICAWSFVVTLVTFVAPFVLPAIALDFASFLSMGLVIGAISLATAPAATLAIIQESKAKGPLTTTLLSVVALDDALAIVAFALAFVVVSDLLQTAEFSTVPFLLSEVGRMGLSFVFGVLAGFVLLWLARFARDRRELLALVLGAVLFVAGLSQQLGLFSVLANIALGFTAVNRARQILDPIQAVKDIEDFVFALFFTLAGSHLDLRIAPTAAILASLIIFGRCGGKLFGAWFGARLSGAPAIVRKYLGITLLPKAGITVGLALLVLEIPEFQAFSTLLINAVLASTLINELLAFPLAKFALARAGEAGR